MTHSRYISIAGRRLRYHYRSNPRSRRVRLTMTRSGLMISGPKSFAIRRLPNLLQEKADWILREHDRLVSVSTEEWPHPSTDMYSRLRKHAASIVRAELRRINVHYDAVVKGVTIRNQSTRWGSCSATGRLSFNYRLVYLPPHLQSYLVTHELCHLIEMNHSKRFWALVAKTIPDFRMRRKELRGYPLR